MGLSIPIYQAPSRPWPARKNNTVSAPGRPTLSGDHRVKATGWMIPKWVSLLSKKHARLVSRSSASIRVSHSSIWTMNILPAAISAWAPNGIPPNSNVYAELGTTWRRLMQDPNQAAHVLGKLFKYVGENNVLWGTDSIWYGSPQDQIQAFRAFQISAPYREQYGYPELTSELRAKVFGLNAAKPYQLAPDEIRKRGAKDRLGRIKAAYLDDPEPSFTTYGPRTRREFMRLYHLKHGQP